jgi:ABC-type dipeptide/oligopeptide/nickel transport system permease subunit
VSVAGTGVAGRPQATPGAVAATPAPRRLESSAWRAFARDRVALAAGTYLAFLAVVALVGPFFEQYGYDQQNLSATYQLPSAAHPLGTDALGRDMLVRIIHGTRISLFIGLTAQVAEVLLGLALGSCAAYYGGRLDGAIMRVADILMAFPPLLLAILLTGILGPSIPNIIFAIVVSGWPAMARTVRGEVLVLKTREFAEAARTLGATDARVIMRHLAPNTLNLVAVRATLGIGVVIMVEATLSFLGIGVQPPMPSLGGMISDAFKFLRSYPYLLVIPSLVLSSIVLAFNFFGEGLADSLNPWTRKI